jgi:hypothetical protein
MFKPSIAITTTLLALLLSGCASISKEECLAGNWEQLGFKDASNGHESSRIGSHIEECGKVGVQIDKNLYTKGYQDGLKVFCTYDRGLQLGKNDGYYREICPAELAGDFRRGYNLGQQIHKIENQIHTIETEMQALETQLSKEVLSYERRRIASEISGKRALVMTLRTQVTILESQTMSMQRKY